MQEQELLAELEELFEDVIDEGTVKLNMATTAKDVDGWDSLNHVQIIYSIEKKYKIKFSLPEMQSFNNVGDLIKGILSKIS